MALLFGLSDNKAAEIIRQEKEQSSSMFYSLLKWNPQLRTETRLVWLRVWGIPVLAWKTDHMRRLVAEVGDLVDVDDDVELMHRLDRARILVRTPRPPLIQHVIHVNIEGVTHRIDMVEENGDKETVVNCHGRSFWSSSEEVFFDVADDDMDTVISWPSGTSPSRDDGAPARASAVDHREPRPTSFSSGSCRDKDPVGNDPPDRSLTTKTSLGTINSPNRKLFELAKDPHPVHPATLHESAAGSDYTCQSLPLSPKAVSNSSPKAPAVRPFEEEHHPSPDQHTLNTNHHNGPLTQPLLFSEKQDHNSIGPCTPEAQLLDHVSPQQQQQLLSNGLQVYSRRKWCKKQKAHQEVLPQNIPVFSSDQEEEAIMRQSELLKQLGLTCGGDCQQLMGNLADMEQRDTDMAAEKGEHICINDNPIL